MTKTRQEREEPRIPMKNDKGNLEDAGEDSIGWQQAVCLKSKQVKVVLGGGQGAEEKGCPCVWL